MHLDPWEDDQNSDLHSERHNFQALGYDSCLHFDKPFATEYSSSSFTHLLIVLGLGRLVYWPQPG